MNWIRALEQAGAKLTPIGKRLARRPEYRRICAFCKGDMGPAGPGFTGDTHGMHFPPCPEAKAMGWGQ